MKLYGIEITSEHTAEQSHSNRLYRTRDAALAAAQAEHNEYWIEEDAEQLESTEFGLYSPAYGLHYSVSEFELAE